ncbi:DUF6186 family protein [Gryllotalpicola sp.]|uniref:DUF6186 family protein n=1 Tax=Gryllotalpicola sp. TaxID=1932787 RepID=UPI00262CF1A0|nr:DUF6186 family protein [Gryllotalpicola sp.]
MSRVITIGGYLVVGVLMLALVIGSHRRPQVVAPLSRLLDRVMALRGVRLTLIAFWWWLGWHFFVTAP